MTSVWSSTPGSCSRSRSGGGWGSRRSSMRRSSSAAGRARRGRGARCSRWCTRCCSAPTASMTATSCAPAGPRRSSGTGRWRRRRSGTFLRSFTFGHVRQLDRVLGQALRRAWAAGAGPGAARLVIDVDTFVGEVHGHAKQGAGYGYTGKLGYHPLLATRADTSEVLHVRLRKGAANTQRGALRFVDELLARVRRAGATGADPAARRLGVLEQEGHRAPARAGLPLLDRRHDAQDRHRADRADPRRRLAARRRLPRHGRLRARRDDARRRPPDRAPRAPARPRRPDRAVHLLAPSRVHHQPHRADARSSTPSTASTPRSSSSSATSKTRRSRTSRPGTTAPTAPGR